MPTTRIGTLSAEMTLEDKNFHRDLVRAARDVRSNTARMNRSFARVDKTVSRASRSISNFASTMARSLGGIAGAYGIGRMAQDMFRVSVEAERMRKGLEAATGGIGKANEAQALLRDTSERLGLVYVGQINAYKKLIAAAQGTAIEGEEVNKVYLAITQSATALQMSQQDVEGSLYAITQMISKGKVSMEELRRQLGERLPGAFQIAAEAMGMTTQELDKFISDGNLMMEDFLPKFAAALDKRFAGAWQESAKTTQSSINRLKNTWWELQTTIMESGPMEAANKALIAINENLKDILETNKPLIQNDLPRFIEMGEKIASVWGKAIGVLSRWPKVALSIPRSMFSPSTDKSLEVFPDANLRGGPDLSSAGIGAPGAYTPSGPRAFVPYAPNLSHLRQATGGTANADSYLGADYREQISYLQKAPIFDLQKMAENAEAGREVISGHIDSLVDEYMRWEQGVIDSNQAATEQLRQGVSRMHGAFTNFFDATSEGFLSLRSLVADLASAMSRMAAENFATALLGGITSGLSGGFGGGTAGTVGQQSMLSFNGGGYIGEGVMGVGISSGKSYQFHPNEFVMPEGKAGGVTNVYHIEAVDAQSFENRFRGSIAKVTAEALNDNDGALWSALARR